MDRISLPSVTLCAATSVNVEATVAALERSLQQAEFGEALLFTDAELGDLPNGVSAVAIPRLESGQAYSEFMLRELGNHVATDHCLVVQWDGFVLDSRQWDPGFLSFDYIGAPWPQFADGHDVGNGGFSLRSRKLLKGCQDRRFAVSHPEDVAIARSNRILLEREHGLRFADRATAGRFAFERSRPRGPTFGFHGVFNMVEILGAAGFWQIYSTLDDTSTIATDYLTLVRQVGQGRGGLARRARLTMDWSTRLLRL